MVRRFSLVGVGLLALLWFSQGPFSEPTELGFFEEVAGEITFEDRSPAERRVELWATSDQYDADGLIVAISNSVIYSMMSDPEFCRDNNYGWNHAYDYPHVDGTCFHPADSEYVYYGRFKVRVRDDGVWRYAPQEFYYTPQGSRDQPATNPLGDVLVNYDVDNNTYTEYKQNDPETPDVDFEFYAPSDYGNIGSVAYGYRWFGTVYVDDDFTIPSGKRVTVNPATSILVAAGKKIIVNGTFEILGTESEPVLVDRQGGSGTWGGIVFNSGSGGTVAYATIRHATKGISVWSASPTLQNNTIEDFSEWGVYGCGNTSVVVEGCTIGPASGAAHGVFRVGT